MPMAKVGADIGIFRKLAESSSAVCAEIALFHVFQCRHIQFSKNKFEATQKGVAA